MIDPYTPNNPTLHIPAPRDHNRLPVNIAKQRARHRQYHTRRLRRRPRPPERNVRVRVSSGFLLRLRDA